MNRSVLLQALPSAEIRAVRTACLTLDGIAIHACPIEGINAYRNQLERGEMMPVGSVEFVQEAMSIAGMEPPPAPGFPAALQPWLHRSVTRTQVSRLAGIAGRAFIKPVQTKLFNGFVFDPQAPADTLDEHDREQLAILRDLEPSTEIWTSPVVEFVCEWRYYVMNGRIAGQARYDPDGTDDAPAPDRQQVERAISAYAAGAPYAIDMGVLSTGQTALVEVHDAWALGLYAMNPKDYYRFLRGYWDHLLQQQHQVA